MRLKKRNFFCSERLLQNVEELIEVGQIIGNIQWQPEFKINDDGRVLLNQTGYNKAFNLEFRRLGWELFPRLCSSPRLIGDARKNDVFVEIQFGNSATLYRDYYKFHYGLTHRLLSLAVLIVPTTPRLFFPIRASQDSVSNMAEFNMAAQYYDLLPIPVPILLIGLEPENCPKPVIGTNELR